jgi:HIRAN domain
MGLLHRRFGDGQGKRGATVGTRNMIAQRPADLRPSWMSEGIEVTLYEGSEDLEVVGESHYQDALTEFASLQGADVRMGVSVEHYVLLVAEPENPYDRNAVSVWLNGEKVGYLSRDDASQLQPGLIRLHKKRGPVALQCRVIGGGPRGDGIGMLGVFLRYDPSTFGRPSSHLEHAAPTIRTGLAIASATDDADDSYDISWYAVLADSVTKRIPQLRRLMGSEREPISRHFVMSMLEDDLYISRELSPGVLDEYDTVCRQHDVEMDEIRPALYAKFDRIPLLDTYRQMAIRQQKAGNYEQALWWTQRGLDLYGDQAARAEWIEDLQSRAARYWNKVHPSQATATRQPGDTTSTSVETLV